MQTATINKPFRHPVQTFTWFRTEWDIAKLINDYDTGKLKPSRSELDREFIEGYATEVLALRKDRPLDKQPMSLIMSVDAAAATALPSTALEEPVILLELAPGKGILKLDGRTTPDHILGDGQHRIAKAFFENTQKLPAISLSRAQARRYMMR